MAILQLNLHHWHEREMQTHSSVVLARAAKVRGQVEVQGWQSLRGGLPCLHSREFERRALYRRDEQSRAASDGTQAGDL